MEMTHSEDPWKTTTIKYFIEDTINDCNEKQIKDFLKRLKKLAELGWDVINKSGRHEYGYENFL